MLGLGKPKVFGNLQLLPKDEADKRDKRNEDSKECFELLLSHFVNAETNSVSNDENELILHKSSQEDVLVLFFLPCLHRTSKNKENISFTLITPRTHI